MLLCGLSLVKLKNDRYWQLVTVLLTFAFLSLEHFEKIYM